MSGSPMRASLRDFVASGSLGSIELGMNQRRIEEILGSPPVLSAPDGSVAFARIWKYGSIELHFLERDDRLSLIFSDDFVDFRGGGGLELDAWILRPGLERRVAEEQLSSAAITYQIRPYPYADESDELVTGAGVSLLFGDKPGVASTARPLWSFWAKR
jgi:hypothetical protein